VFGRTTPTNSTKGFTGHTLGAAGITEVAIAAMALERSMIPGSLNTTNLDEDIAINYQFENSAADIKYAMSNSFGFGGSNCSVVLGRGA
jgi:3-oxoacyl-[acyl-carrier-protein] synthase I